MLPVLSLTGSFVKSIATYSRNSLQVEEELCWTVCWYWYAELIWDIWEKDQLEQIGDQDTYPTG